MASKKHNKNLKAGGKRDFQRPPQEWGQLNASSTQEGWLHWHAHKSGQAS
jgi:hypothetical protein